MLYESLNNKNETLTCNCNNNKEGEDNLHPLYINELTIN